eukprot:4818-Eustigmatos_ZCMA.PRE.1
MVQESKGSLGEVGGVAAVAGVAGPWHAHFHTRMRNKHNKHCRALCIHVADSGRKDFFEMMALTAVANS